MRIRRIEVTNFRALRNSSLDLTDTTALLGENNCGKSAFLLALNLFFESSPKTNERDFSDNNTADPINITVHFSDLTPYDREEFQSNLLDGSLIITRRFTFGSSDENSKYFVSARVNPDFSQCRNETGKTKKLKLYESLREKYGPSELPKEKNSDEIERFLADWEAKHSDALKIEKVAAFKGWTNVAAGKLKSKTSYVFIRAVQDAAEDLQQSKSSPVKSLIDTIARQTIENGTTFKEFMADANKTISKLTDPKEVPILAEISDGLTRVLSDFYKDSEIVATWDPVTSIQPSFPSANLDVKNNEYVTGIDGVGHGLQRAVILTVLRFMADHRARQDGVEEEFSEPQSDLIVAIEEPEIYQHPTKQRLFGKLLRSLSKGFSKQTGIRVQMIFVTHSPLLVSMSECQSIRMLRIEGISGQKNVSVKDISLAECSKRSAEVSGQKPEDAWSPAQFGAKLHNFNSEIAEGFFAKCVVLVEGVGDKAIIEAWYRINNRDPHAEGIVVAEVAGKNNLSRPIIVFEKVGVPCYWIFDNDKSGKSKNKDQNIAANRILQRLGGVDAEKCEDWPEGQYDYFTSWDNKLEDFVRGKAGADRFNQVSEELSKEFDIDSNMCLKFPASAMRMLQLFRDEGTHFPELDNVLSAVDKLVEG